MKEITLTIPDELYEKLVKESSFKNLSIEILCLDKLINSVSEIEERSKYYIQLSEIYLTKAIEYFKKGDLLQTSEKLWEAATLIVKAFAEKKNIRHYRHRDLEKVVSVIFKETRNRRILELWSIALRLHSNFYENFMISEEIEVCIEEIKEFVNEIKKIIEKLT